MRDDLPIPIRRELDQERLAFIRWIGTQYEWLIANHIDPKPWMASVVTLLHEYAEEQGYDEDA